MIFVDTSFWIALRNRRDDHHIEAAALYDEHSHASLITTNHVRGETWTFLRRRLGHPAAVTFVDALPKSQQLSMVFVSTMIETQALSWLRHRDEKSCSFVDATSFATMKSMRIRDCLAFDGDFSAAGFRELRASR